MTLSCALSTALTASRAPARATPQPPINEIATQPADQQAHWLARAAADGTLAHLADAELVALFRSLDPGALPRYLRDGLPRYATSEFTILRRERIRGKWPKRADHMLVRVTRDPLRVYARWLPDGAHAGQEVIYDECKRPGELYGHLGGFFGVVPMWASLNGPLARAQSNHSIRELGIDAITQRFIDEGRKFAEAGITRPSDIAVTNVNGVRVVALTYIAPAGRPEFYAKRELLYLDLAQPRFRAVASFDNDGAIFESVVFGHIEPKPFDDLTFDPHNAGYRF
ncbi:DUF1571 domain-containing protein [Caballeronia sp. LZ062]|uniref:DUF1571 domain-containing protein n=1 Tax=unclassified Caballeronia TaxID=2646786 RepID=UPI002864FF2D|nr:MULTISPECIES: DUF1571 domain-containing protein [unclassified Caballeronia]MDR5854720.1 DUF1571 domain-containing protein [Caballeronia sp. LZ050]MDR5870751.1 DUF1571 domain-containing protein [Caballeronia sp. LZ062]